jgi:hypothetical protein
MKKIDATKVPLNCRFVETVSPGFFFGDTCESRCPKESWSDAHSLARDMRRESKDRNAVGFRRFVYDPERGKTYLDEGWIYFKGRGFTKSELLSGTAERSCPEIKKALTSTAKCNIEYNNWNCIFIEKTHSLWPLHEEDVVL